MTRRSVTAYVRSAPATYIYLFTLTVTSWVLQTASGPLAHRLIFEQSTNLERLGHDPLHVLVSSAFWLEHARDLLFWAVLFTLVLAPAERWLGAGRWVLTFAVGHVGATLATAAAIWLSIRWDVVDERLSRAQDVGASYGFFAVAATFTFALSYRDRLIYSLALWTAIAAGALLSDGVSATGHVIAVLIGYACWLAYGRPARGKRGSWPSASSAATPARGSPSRPS